MKNILRKKEERNEYYEDHKDYLNEQNKQYRDNNKERIKEYDKVRNQVRDQIKVNCPNCNCEIVKRKLNRHLQTQKCKSSIQPDDCNNLMKMD